ncbi:hypothetical protein Ddc_09305 [Ditylenchus destructor]|nr:hypothetical protein Ddc_09305 [Ditylenchus destructor]
MPDENSGDDRLKSVSETVWYYSKTHFDFQIPNGKPARRRRKSASDVLCKCCAVYVDHDYLRGWEGTMKIFEICLCCLSILLALSVNGVEGERGFSIFISSLALSAASAILICKLLTLNRRLTPQHWFVMETGIYTALSIGFLASASLMTFVCATFWADNSPNRQSLPLLEAVVLGGCAFIFVIDALIVYKHRRIRTWIPFVSDYRI